MGVSVSCLSCYFYGVDAAVVSMELKAAMGLNLNERARRLDLKLKSEQRRSVKVVCDR